MTKISVNFCIDIELLANLDAYATEAGCTLIDLIEQFCQQGLEVASKSSTSLDARINKPQDNILTRVNAVETDIKSILERLSVLESKVDVDVDVNDFLQNWQKSLELEVASLVEKRVDKRLETARHLAESEHPDQGIRSDVKSDFIAEKAKGITNGWKIDLDCDDEPDEILTDFLKP